MSTPIRRALISVSDKTGLVEFGKFLADRGVELVRSEVWPVGVTEVELRVGRLPQQEVGDPALPRGPDDEVGVGHLGVVQVSADGLLVDVVGPGPVGHQLAHRVDDLGPTPVVEGDGQRHGRVVAGELDAVVDHPQESARHAPVATPDRADAHVALVKLVATQSNERGPVFSPDGRYFAYVSDENGRDEVYVQEYADAKNDVVDTILSDAGWTG